MAGGESAHERDERIAALVEELQRQGIRDGRVLEALARVPRDRFVPEERQEDAWANVALPIGAGQTISQPYVVALMTEALALTGTERVLEIGTGSGYQTAILAELTSEVISIERHASLAERAVATLTALGYRNVSIHIGDGTAGWPAAAPYERIIVTASGPRVPPPLLKQLDPSGGRLVIPVGEQEGEQRLIAVTREGADLREQMLGPVRFVPLIGRAGWAAQIQENGHHG
ncbi:MAG: protein-L-isoaspartate(D-aspartate) O-methyltransferase [Chloroflexota bacterium]|nr:protein-L-isoaspartate(D-aspartate) O-methyltransferase [Chloroflexota bacterium]